MSETFKIFLIDDDEDAVITLTADLKAKGHDVTGFSSVPKFLESFRKEIPQVVLVDMVNMEMPGWQICQKIRNTTGLEEIKVIAISGVLDREDVGRMDLKADAFLEKPLNADDVEKALAKLFPHG